jgi:hypothetical protein
MLATMRRVERETRRLASGTLDYPPMPLADFYRPFELIRRFPRWERI